MIGKRLYRAGALVTVSASLAIVAIGWLPAGAATAAVSVVANGASGCSNAYCYQPPSESVNVTDGVTWSITTTYVQHTVTRCGAAPGQNDSGCPAIGAAGNDGNAGDTFGSALLSTNVTYNHGFASAGAYTYYCEVHGYGVMHGTVNVAGTTKGPSPSPSQAAASSPTPSATGAAAAAAVSLPRSGSGQSGGNTSAVWLIALLGLLVAAGLVLVSLEASRRQP